mgnify:CR=1 FL=1
MERANWKDWCEPSSSNYLGTKTRAWKGRESFFIVQLGIGEILIGVHDANV